jgi:EmrB/QacA subfamily drug resistance transporter
MPPQIIYGEQQGMKKSVLFAATAGAFLTPFMGSAVNVALPRIAVEFSMSAVTMSWFAMAYILAAAAFLLPFGALADRHGRKRVFLLGTAVYSVSSVCVCLAGTLPLLLAFRVIQGAGGAMIFGTGVAMLTSVFAPEERGRVLGWNVAAVYSGLSLGPVIGGLLTALAGWRSIFWINAALGTVVWAVITLKVKTEWKHEHSAPFDGAGGVLYGASLASLMFGLSKLPSIPGGAFVAAGAAGLAGFAWRECHNAREPLFDMNLFLRNRVFAFSNLAALINYSATAAVAFLLSLYLQYVKGLDPKHAGLVLVAQPIVMALFSPLTGRLSDRIAPRTLASAGMAVSSASLVLFAFAGRETSIGWVVACQMLLGFGFALFSSPNTNAVMGSVQPRQYGVASATLGTMRLVGQMLSMGFAAMLLALFVGGRAVTPEAVPAFLSAQRTAFTVTSAVCFAGVFASLARGKKTEGIR